jgi:hypothetical protein
MAPVEDAAARCYTRYHVAGTVVVQATISPSGRVDIAVARPPFAGTQTGACVAQLAKNAVFPSFRGKPMKVLYPFVVDADLE